MSISVKDCCILNGGDGSWAFEPLANELADILGIEISSQPRRFNYLLHVEDLERVATCNSFIPLRAIRLASDKRLIAEAFDKHRVPTPETRLIHEFNEVHAFIEAHSEREWCLKYPTSCGANGHRLLTKNAPVPANWPRPFVVQEFIRLPEPEVYRTYCAGGDLFGWIVRRFPPGTEMSPWVAHARGARYAPSGEAPTEAIAASRKALAASGILDSFGCADLICAPDGKWLVLEIGTDGLFNHVDRYLDDPELEDEMKRRLSKAFWRAADLAPITG